MSKPKHPKRYTPEFRHVVTARPLEVGIRLCIYTECAEIIIRSDLSCSDLNCLLEFCE